LTYSDLIVESINTRGSTSVDPMRRLVATSAGGATFTFRIKDVALAASDTASITFGGMRGSIISITRAVGSRYPQVEASAPMLPATELVQSRLTLRSSAFPFVVSVVDSSSALQITNIFPDVVGNSLKRPSSVPATVERVDCLKGSKMAYVTASTLQPTATTSASIVAGSVVSPQDCAAQTCTQLQRPIPAIPAGVSTSTITNVVTGVKAEVAITATAVTPLLSSPVATATVVRGSVAGGTVTQVTVTGFPVVASTSDVLFKVGSATGVVNRVVSSTIDSTVLIVTTPSRSAGPQAASVSFVSSGSDRTTPATGTFTFTYTLREPAVRQAYPLYGLDVGGYPMYVTLTGFPAVASGLASDVTFNFGGSAGGSVGVAASQLLSTSDVDAPTLVRV
jgi:hypothetical protein